MKALILIVALALTTDAISQAKPVSMKGQADSGYTLPKQEIQVPNKQYTNLGGLAGLIETGNFNALENPGGEHVTSGFGWTAGVGSFTTPTAAFHSGKQSVRVTSTLSQLNVSQTSTINAAALTSTQGVASAWVNTTRADMQICARVDGADSGCISINNDGIWREYVIPFVFGSTSYGIVVQSTVSGSGSVSIDDAYVGFMPSTMTPEVAQAQLAGSSYFAGTTSCTWSRTSTTVGAFTSTAACPGPTIVPDSVSLGSWQTTDSDLPRQTINNLPAGKCKATFEGNITSAAGNSVLAINDGTTTCQPTFLSNTNSVTGASVSCVFNYTSSGNRVFELYGASSASSLTVNSSLTSPSATGVKFTLECTPPASKVYSQPNNVDTDWVDCGLTTADFTGFGTVSSIEDQCKKDGADLLMRVKFVSGTSTATEARVNLRLTGTALTSANSTIVPTLQIAGVAARSNPSGTETIWPLIEPSVAYSTFGVQVSTSSALTKINGSSMIASGATLFYSSRIPIAGWTKTQITGTFANVVTAPGLGKPRLIYAQFAAPSAGACVTSAEPSEWITGNATSAGAGQCSATMTGWSSTPFCWAQHTIALGNANYCQANATSTTALVVQGVSGGTPTNLVCNVFCFGLVP